MSLLQKYRTSELDTLITHIRVIGESTSSQGYPVTTRSEEQHTYWAKVTMNDISEALPGDTPQQMQRRMDMVSYKIVLRNEKQIIKTNDRIIIPTLVTGNDVAELIVRTISGDHWFIEIKATIKI